MFNVSCIASVIGVGKQIRGTINCFAIRSTYFGLSGLCPHHKVGVTMVLVCLNIL